VKRVHRLSPEKSTVGASSLLTTRYNKVPISDPIVTYSDRPPSESIVVIENLKRQNNHSLIILKLHKDPLSKENRSEAGLERKPSPSRIKQRLR